ncbi:hypothetical protein Tsubulata_039878 [Turnera subulata]|uniref:Protein CPR-5 n=1 Tax=Turnera subulata TaxID=218843 RepID=A0A9Q0G391_9ROSI|nr:hypothetical protein Tsubulata_039878 [Turnera subulata]
MNTPPSPASPHAVACHPNRTADSLLSAPEPVVDDSRKPIKKKKKKPIFRADGVAGASSSSSVNCAPPLPIRRRSPKVVVAPLHRFCGRGGGAGIAVESLEAIALSLGMSFAAVVAQVLERDGAAGERMPVHHLSMICTSAVRESLANIFGDKSDFFARNFEKSFGSTLSTLRLINESSINKGSSHQNMDYCSSDKALNKEVRNNDLDDKDCHSDTDLPSTSTQNQTCIPERVEESLLPSNRELTVHGQISQPSTAHSSFGSVINQLSLEQARSNDLKTVEIGLNLRRLKLKEAQLALSFESNHVERSKLDLNRSKTSFKIEKFKTQLGDSRQVELLKTCNDCLIAGLFIVIASLLYGAYVFSHKRISEATASCSPSHEESKSWWIPRPFSSVNSELQTLRCQVQVVSRMLFGILMILAITYLLLQRSVTSQQATPITFIFLLLGVACGFAGKLGIDTLGGSGAKWLLYWEILCLVHFTSNFWISACFRVLYGPVAVTDGMKHNAMIPFWFRRFVFYAVVLMFLPLCCGLLPFGNPGEWKDHFLLRVADVLSSTDD